MGAKIALCADVHLGNHRTLGGVSLARMNDRFRETLRIFREACRRARAAGAAALVVLGDLFDADDPNPAMVRAVLDALRTGPDRAILLLGNHEMHSDQEHDHALASLGGVWGSTKIDVIDRPTHAWVGDLPLCLVPFRPGKAADWLPGAIRDAGPVGDIRRLLCIHLGISDSDTASDEPWMMGCHDQINVDDLDDMIGRFNLSGVAAGNWHKHMLWDGDEQIFQCGALVPTGWNNAGGDEWYGTLGYWDGDRFSRDVISGPRYLKFGSYADWLPNAGNETIRARIVVPAARMAMVRERLDTEPVMGHVEVLADETTTQRRARSAAIAAQSAASDASALAAYVGGIELPGGVSPVEVLETCKRYLGGVTR
jgi:hypothetical protein